MAVHSWYIHKTTPECIHPSCTHYLHCYEKENKQKGWSQKIRNIEYQELDIFPTQVTQDNF